VANPTTNYGFVLPTPTDLVTDLPADFDVALQGVDTRLKALQPGTTLGDIAYSSATANTNTRLGIGTTGQVLAVSGGVPAWTTPAVASSAMTLVSRVSFSNVANTGTSFDGVFTSTYKSYQIVLETLYAATAADDLLWQWRYAGPTTQAANNYSNCINTNPATSTVTNSGVNGGSANTLTTRIGGSADPGGGIIFATGVSGVSTTPVISGMYYECSNSASANFSGMTVTARIYTGFILSSSSSNITGTVAVYGLA
jgi:hypothetical protein